MITFIIALILGIVIGMLIGANLGIVIGMLIGANNTNKVQKAADLAEAKASAEIEKLKSKLSEWYHTDGRRKTNAEYNGYLVKPTGN